LELTIDSNLQEFAMRRLGDESAALVVMDIHSGELQALVSAPSYDPNGFTQGMRSETWNELLTNPRNPLTNKAIAGQYSPGSTFKIVTAMAGLESGAISANTVVHCNGTYEYGDTVFHCWNRRGHGQVGLERAIKESCDVFFYETAKRTGIDALAAMGRKFGIGQPLGIDLNNEKGGLMPDKAWKLQTLKKPWITGETMSCGIGQSYVQTTPLQLATMTARLVNGGKAVIPRLAHRVGGVYPEAMPQAPFDDLQLNPEHVRMVMRGLDAVVNQPGGTAYASRLNDSGWEMGGKTGTAQVRRITRQERSRGLRPQHEMPWEERDNALFVAYAPLAAPRYACAVVVEHGMHGGWVAPIARDILLETLRRDQGIDVRNDQPKVKGVQVIRAGGEPASAALLTSEKPQLQPGQAGLDTSNGGDE
ncbi:MAG: penicillin-binding protein 2, partial [Alphaproteobacteria bacterium]|nr:penicillin-binding protein 2 [Alphaproteobacteria bacterium]